MPISQVAVGKLKELSVFGNDYPTPDGHASGIIYMMDPADGHIKALEKLKEDPGAVAYNLAPARAPASWR